MQEIDAHVLCIQESNLNWTDCIRCLIYNLFQTAFMHTKISTSNSIEHGNDNYQPGGTFLATLGCYAARVITTGTDPTGMGRWTYHELIGQRNNWYMIITAYRVGPQQLTIGTQMAYTQQYNILLTQNDLHPDPRERFVVDIIAFVRRWQTTHGILLCLDANDNIVESRDKGIERIIDETALIDLHQYRHPNLTPPATYNRGRLTIDYCLGTPQFAQALTAAWMMPFGIPITLSGDHRTMGVEFDHNILFGQKVLSPPPSVKCGIYSTAYPTVRKFNDIVAEECAQLKLYDQAQDLTDKYLFSDKDHDRLEDIDQQLTKILTRADQRLAHYRNSPWSPELHQAFLCHRFWTVSLSQACTKRDFSTTLQMIASWMTTPPADSGSLTSNLKKAQQVIREIRREAVQRREAHLQELLDAAQQTNDKGHQKLIKHLCQAEQNQKCFQIHRQFMKP